jgi:hypothetical protein
MRLGRNLFGIGSSKATFYESNDAIERVNIELVNTEAAN